MEPLRAFRRQLDLRYKEWMMYGMLIEIILIGILVLQGMHR